jgi:succinyl-CoA synthetase alpha subunit
MIYRKNERVLIQGITGKQGGFWTEKMQSCGTDVVAGVNPKRAGERHLGVPVYATAIDAMRATPYEWAVMFIPPASAKEAAIDAIEAGTKNVVVLTEHIPAHDVIAIQHAARNHGTRVIGPNTAGVVTPGEGFIGIMPGDNVNVFQPGEIGVISRSGSLGTLVCLNLTRAKLGQSAFLGIGGDPMIGTTTREALMALDQDQHTRAIVLVGEIGGAMEEDAAEYARTMKKPIVSFIAGRASPPGKKMGHAGAIVSGNMGSYAGKRGALEAAGVAVADTPSQIPLLLNAALASHAKPEAVSV